MGSEMCIRDRFHVLACIQALKPAISHFVSDKLTTTTTVKGIQPYASSSCGIAILATYHANFLAFDTLNFHANATKNNIAEEETKINWY